MKVKRKARHRQSNARSMPSGDEDGALPSDKPLQGVAPSMRNLWLLRLLLRAECLKRLRGSYSRGGIDDALGLDEHDFEGPDTPERLRALLVQFEASAARRSETPYCNVVLLGERLGLDAEEREILSFAAVLATDAPLQRCFEALGRLSIERLRDVLAKALALEPTAVHRALSAQGKLAQTGLVHASIGSYAHSDESPLVVGDAIQKVLWAEHASAQAMLFCFCPTPPPPMVSLSDYPHADTDIALLKRLLGAAISKKEKGVNVLLYGAPATGKTQLSRALGAFLEAHVVEVASEDEDGDTLSGYERLASYKLAQSLLSSNPDHANPDHAKDAPRNLLVFDESEDAFPMPFLAHGMFGGRAMGARGKGAYGKAARIRMLEDNAVPAIWIANHVSHIDTAILRRFAFVVELRRPPPAIRRRILEHHLADLPIGEPWLRTAAADTRLQPGHIQRAAATVRLMAPVDADDAERALDRTLAQSMRVMGEPPAAVRRTSPTGPYDLDLLNASCNLQQVVAGLAGQGRGSVCLYGPPGTGKTAFVQHLKAQLGLPLLTRRASDILSSFVGQTERNFARIFEEASDEGAILFLDEADSFLRDRGGARQSWEVTLVNELLGQIERFEGVFICATNLVDQTDRAALRRFGMKIRFETLSADQRWRLFRKACRRHGASVPRRAAALSALKQRLSDLDGLTVGDFAALHEGYALTGGPPDASAIAEHLQDELELKQRGPKRRIGFGGDS